MTDHANGVSYFHISSQGPRTPRPQYVRSWHGLFRQWRAEQEQLSRLHARPYHRPAFILERNASADGDSASWDLPVKDEAELEKEQITQNLSEWPFTGTEFNKNTMLCPYFRNEFAAYSGRIGQKSMLLEVLNKYDTVRSAVFNLIFLSHTTASNFSATCRLAMELVRYETDIWDISTGYYHGCNVFPSDDPNAHSAGISVAPFIVVTPVRFPDVPKPSYVQEVQNLHKLCIATKNFADYLQVMQMHRIPFLTPDLLSLLIPQLRNLRILGIYKCQLIHIGHGVRLLEIIKTDKPLRKEKQVYLDWYPNFHVGPVDVAGENAFTGSYGVTWDDARMDTRLGIWKHVTEILPIARDQNIDFTGKHTAFRQWLDRSPLWKVAQTLEALEDPKKSTAEMVAMINYPHLRGKVGKIFEDQKQLSNMPHGRAWMVDLYTCGGCNESIPGVFYQFPEIKEFQQYQTSPLCLGCKLNSILEDETDHIKIKKRNLMKTWLSDMEHLEGDEEAAVVWNTNDISKAIEDFEAKDVVRLARKLDKTRPPYTHRHGQKSDRCLRDHEYDEIQRPTPKAYLGRRGDYDLRAPTIAGKDKSHDELGQWNWYRLDRVHAHGWV